MYRVDECQHFFSCLIDYLKGGIFRRFAEARELTYKTLSCEDPHSLSRKRIAHPVCSKLIVRVHH